MMLELKDASLTIEGRELFKKLSFMALDGQLTCITGPAGSGKTAMVQVMLGFLPLDDGLVSIDGELLTPKSAPFFRRQMAYVPQRLLVPEGYDKVPTDYVSLLRKAVESGKQLLVVDEPSKELTMEERQVVNNLFREAQERGATVLAVNMVTAQNQVTL